MTTQEVIDELRNSKALASSTMQEIEDNRKLRLEMVQYFDKNKDRDFALALLRIVSEMRLDPGKGISGDSLMLACYILGKHGQVEDCMKVWETKRIDFDTYSYVDIQLMVFAGVQQTIKYLQTQTTEEAKNALAYVGACSKAGEFDNIEQYFKETPWYV